MIPDTHIILGAAERHLAKYRRKTMTCAMKEGTDACYEIQEIMMHMNNINAQMRQFVNHKT